MFGLKRKPKLTAYYSNAGVTEYWVEGQEILNEAHVLIAGSTGCGKSTLIHKLMWTALSLSPGRNQFIIIDMKMGVEMKRYRNLPHVLRFAQTDSEALSALDYAMEITQQRLTEMNKTDATMYDGSNIYVVIDELGYLLQACGREALDRLTALSRIARASRVHLLMASQDPSRKGCPAAIQVNCTCLIGMKCRDAMQSRQIIGMSGCETLPRHGLAYMVQGSEVYTLPITLMPESDIQDRINYWLDKSRCMVYR